MQKRVISLFIYLFFLKKETLFLSSKTVVRPRTETLTKTLGLGLAAFLEAAWRDEGKVVILTMSNLAGLFNKFAQQ